MVAFGRCTLRALERTQRRTKTGPGGQRSSPPSLHLQAESPPVLAVDVIVAADPPDELVSPGSIRGVGADDGAAEEEISQRYLRREGDFVEIITSPEGGIVHVIHPAFQGQAEILIEMN